MFNNYFLRRAQVSNLLKDGPYNTLRSRLLFVAAIFAGTLAIIADVVGIVAFTFEELVFLLFIVVWLGVYVPIFLEKQNKVC